MRRIAIALLGLFLLAALGCGPSEADKPEFDLAGEYAKLEATKNQIDELRTKLAGIDEKIDILEQAKKNPRKFKKEDLPAEDLATLQTERSETAAAADDKLNTFFDNLTMFLNKGLNDFPDAPQTQQAVRMYSDENIRVANEHIAKGGKYNKAIDIYKQALQYDPNYQVLLEKIKEAEELRFITKDRFDEVTNGMSMEQVKQICGVPNINFIKEYQERGRTIIAWFYPRQDASAAGFYFYKGNLYNKRWTAVKKEE